MVTVLVRLFVVCADMSHGEVTVARYRLLILPLFATASFHIYFLFGTFCVLLLLDGAVAFALLLPLLLLELFAPASVGC